MTIVAPPRPPEEQHDLEALIEEARRRTRRRRLKYVAAAFGALLAGGGIYGGMAFIDANGSSARGVPAGFAVVQAKGPVSHALIELSGFVPRVVDVATGRERPARVTQELWWDRKTNLYRVVDRVEGQVAFDLVGYRCTPAHGLPGGRLCTPPPPLSEFRWPPDPHVLREFGRGTFRGRDVIWFETLVNGKPTKPRDDAIGVDARTHVPFVLRQLFRGQLVAQQVITSRSELDPSDVSFLVPEGGAPERSYPPSPETFTDSFGSGRDAARHALGRAALWLGPTFEGHPVASIRANASGMLLKTGRKVLAARSVTFDYGTVKVEVFRPRPFWFEYGPRTGQIVLDGRALLSRDGFLVVITGSNGHAIDRVHALALAKSLKPVPAA